MEKNEHTTSRRNVLPENLKDHTLALKYRYIDYDEEIGVPVHPGFIIDDFPLEYTYPVIFSKTHNALADLKETSMRKGDYLLCSPVKAGTHWTWETMGMLLDSKPEYRQQGKDQSWIEVTPIRQIHERYPSPTVLNTHLTLGALPANFMRDDTKVVVTLRNLKDVMVSKYYHLSQMHPLKWEDSFKESLHSKHSMFGSLFDVYADLWDHRQDPNVLIVFFEDFKKNTRKVVEKIANHMGVPHTPEFITEVTTAVQFSNMKKGKYNSEESFRLMTNNEDATLFRKGDIGDWKNHFTDEQNKEFHKKFDEWNKERQIPMIFE